MPYPDSVSWYELALARNFADAGTGREEVVQVVREGVELVVRDAVQAHEEVVAEHRRDGDEQAERRHDQDRKSVGEGKSVSVRVDLCGRRVIKKQQQKKKKNK